MRIRVVTARELDPALLERWAHLQASEPSLASPYFHPYFTLCTAAVNAEVRVAIMEDAGGAPVGFFPHQRRRGAGVPVGDHLSDHHGVVAARGTHWNWQRLLAHCGLGYWTFHHLCEWQSPGHEVHSTASPGLDLSRGFEDWWRLRLALGRRVAQLPRKARKLEREIGPLRFEPHVRDSRLLQWVIDMKSRQCLRTGARDCFTAGWTRELVHRIAAHDDPDFGGRLSVLYAGDRPVAAHFGMRCRHVWHWWFPVYDSAYAAFSPGALLLMNLAAHAAQTGHRWLDLGKGDEPYKRSFANAHLPIVEGCVQRPAFATTLRDARKGLGRWLRTSAWAQPVRPLMRRLGRL